MLWVNGRTVLALQVLVVLLGANLLISNIMFSSIHRERHIEERDAPSQSYHDVAVLQAEVSHALDKIVHLKLQLMEAVEKNKRDQEDQLQRQQQQQQQPEQQGVLRSVNTQAQSVSASSFVAIPSGSSSLPYLTIAMSTVARRGTEYLSETLGSIASQLSFDPKDPLYGQIRVFVFNADTSKHEAFEANRARFTGDSAFTFLVRELADQEVHSTGPVSAPVQRQTRDLVKMLSAVIGKSQYLLVMEDDFSLCPYALATVRYILNKLHIYFPSWLSLKVSYGFNGIVLKNGVDGADVAFLAKYLEEHQSRRPPDHLWTELVAGETAQSRSYKNNRPHTAFRYNLLQHRGRISTLRERISPEHERCFTPLVAPVLFDVEAFREDQCGHTDIQPCPPKPLVLQPFIDEPYRVPQSWLDKELRG